MTILGLAARPLIAGMFIYGGIDSFRHPSSKEALARKVVGDFPEQLGTGLYAAQVVRLNGAVQVGAGVALASGVAPRIAALALAGSLVPTTLAGHRFWEERDAAKRHAQTIQFLKNLSMLGGLLLAAADTGGRPSIPWRARRAVGTTVVRAHDALTSAAS